MLVAAGTGAAGGVHKVVAVVAALSGGIDVLQRPEILLGGFVYDNVRCNEGICRIKDQSVRVMRIL